MSFPEASLASLAVVSAAYQLAAKRRQSEGSATGYLSRMGVASMEGRK